MPITLYITYIERQINMCVLFCLSINIVVNICCSRNLFEILAVSDSSSGNKKSQKTSPENCKCIQTQTHTNYVIQRYSQAQLPKTKQNKIPEICRVNVCMYVAYVCAVCKICSYIMKIWDALCWSLPQQQQQQHSLGPHGIIGIAELGKESHLIGATLGWLQGPAG